MTIDYYSSFTEVDPLPDTASRSVITKLKTQFARHGIPQILVTDNGPHFLAEEFRSFCKKWEFMHIQSSPYYPQGNGKAESSAKVVKQQMKTAVTAHQDPWLALLDQRNTPQQGLNSSPAQRLFSRGTNTLLSMKGNMLKPQVREGVPEGIAEQHHVQTQSYDRGAKDLSKEDVVRMEPGYGKKCWKKAILLHRENWQEVL